MPEIGIKELKTNASKIIEKVEGGASYVVTKRGRPAAVLLPIEEAEDVVLANADEFVQMRRRARADYRARRTTNLQNLD